MRRKRKGDDFERQVASILADELGADIRRVLLSGPRGEGDVEGIPEVHIECRRRERVRLGQWFEEESHKANGKPFALIHKRSREPVFVTMSLSDWMRLFREILR
jgi:Holliday junction resolvase